MLFVRVDEGEVACLQGSLLPFLVNQGTAALDHIDLVHYNLPCNIYL